MNINQIKYVLEAAGASSMREASTRLFVSQPALSASIGELEEELGISASSATRLLRRMMEDGVVIREGKAKSTRYRLKA